MPEMKHVLYDLYLDVMYHLEKPEDFLASIKSSSLYASLCMKTQDHPAFYLREYLNGLSTLDRFDKKLLGDFCKTYSSKVNSELQDLFPYRIFLPLAVKTRDDGLMAEFFGYAKSWPKTFRLDYAPVYLAPYRTNPAVAGFLADLVINERSATALTALICHYGIRWPQTHPCFSQHIQALKVPSYDKVPKKDLVQMTQVFQRLKKGASAIQKTEKEIQTLEKELGCSLRYRPAIYESDTELTRRVDFDGSYGKRLKLKEAIIVEADIERLESIIEELQDRASNGP